MQFVGTNHHPSKDEMISATDYYEYMRETKKYIERAYMSLPSLLLFAVYRLALSLPLQRGIAGRTGHDSGTGLRSQITGGLGAVQILPQAKGPMEGRQPTTKLRPLFEPRAAEVLISYLSPCASYGFRICMDVTPLKGTNHL
jgi:hypothetical protein